MKLKTNILSVCLCWLGLPSIHAEELSIINPSFEQGSKVQVVYGSENIPGWEGDAKKAVGVEQNPFHSPVHGSRYLFHEGGGEAMVQLTKHKLRKGRTYTLTLWARSINPLGVKSATEITARLMARDKVLAESVMQVDAPSLKGAPVGKGNDDGANVWIDGDYRHQFADVHMIQAFDKDPIEDEWEILEDSGYDAINRLGWAVGNIIVGENKYIYGTIYRDSRGEFYSSITMTKVLEDHLPDYRWSEPVILMNHSPTEFPWVEDPHLFYDEEANRLWMSWGGGVCYVSELDPATGLFLNNPADPEFDTHPEGMHHAVAKWPETDDGWCGDEWSRCWMEGAALYKHGEYWYYLGSYGHLGRDYTIRYGRGTSPTGPFYDKHGVDLMTFDQDRNAYGNTILLGAEGEQMVPGHPHIWEEEGKFYMGYDYRKPGSGKDLMGIRRLYWVDDWPTIWFPVEVSFNVDDHPEAIGEKLTISFQNSGRGDSRLAVDHVQLMQSRESR